MRICLKRFRHKVHKEGFSCPNLSSGPTAHMMCWGFGCWMFLQELQLNVGTDLMPWSQKDLNTGRLCLISSAETEKKMCGIEEGNGTDLCSTSKCGKKNGRFIECKAKHTWVGICRRKLFLKNSKLNVSPLILYLWFFYRRFFILSCHQALQLA